MWPFISLDIVVVAQFVKTTENTMFCMYKDAEGCIKHFITQPKLQGSDL